MAWTNLTFSVGQILTAAQMTNLDDNFEALAAKDSGAPQLATSYVTETMMGSSAISQSKLKTSSGSVSNSSSTPAIFILPGGSYGFYPQLRIANAAGKAFASISGVGMQSTSFSTVIELASAGSYIAYAQQRYLQASPPYNLGHGDIPLFVFATVDNATSEIVSTYIADTPPWIYNGPTQAWADEYADNGDHLRKKKVPEKLKKDRLIDIKSMDDYLLSAEEIKGKYEIITQEIKNADMSLIPHPFNNLAEGQTIIAIDPLSKLMDRLCLFGDQGEDMTDIIRNNVKIDNAAIAGSGFDASVMVVAANWK